MSERRVDIITAALPPSLDGIGDYTGHLAAELAKSCRVRVLAGGRQPPLPIAGVEIERVFDAGMAGSIGGIVAAMPENSDGWVLVQYNPFSYGRRGYCPQLPGALRSLKRKSPGLRVALMLHETYTPFGKFKQSLMSLWQRLQLWALVHAADRVFCACSAWAEQASRMKPACPVLVLGVGSNIPRIAIERGRARRRLGIPETACVLGFFGRAHPSRLPEWAASAGRALARVGNEPLILYIGPDAKQIVPLFDDVPTIGSEGPLTAEEVSLRFSAMDLHLAVYTDGVSARRTAFMTGLQHAIATVGTHGIHTDPFFEEQDGASFQLASAADPDEFNRHVVRLAEDSRARSQLGLAGNSLYERKFDWTPIAAQLLSSLDP